MADSIQRSDSVESLTAPSNAVAVIMAGGAGTRFWPASTQEKPKQFMSIFSERSLLQQAYDRVASWLPCERILVLTSHAHMALCREQLPQLAPDQVIGEPERKDTAAAVACAALIAEKRFGDATMMILAADHLMQPHPEVKRSFFAALQIASKQDALVTLGIPPTFPATGFGYLKLEPKQTSIDGVDVFPLKAFVEKPNLETATQYVKDGQHLWNSGMFFWRTSVIREAFQRHLPNHLQHLQACADADQTDGFEETLASAFSQLERISVDYGIMEHAQNIQAVKATFQWSDVGGFNALAEHLEADDNGNVCRGQLYSLDSQNNIVFSDRPDEVIGLLGAKDLIVVRVNNRTLIASRDRAQDIKKLVDQLPDALK